MAISDMDGAALHDYRMLKKLTYSIMFLPKRKPTETRE